MVVSGFGVDIIFINESKRGIEKGIIFNASFLQNLSFADEIIFRVSPV